MSDHPKKMLVVDDDDIWRPRLARAMRERGLEVTTASDYDEAMQAAKDDHFDYAVVDLRMPGKGGLEVVRDLHERDAALKIVVLTGYGSISTTVDAIRLGAVNYMQKPADADDILTAFEKSEHEPLDPPEPKYDEAPSLARAEWEHINRVLSDCGGNITHAAKKLGIHRRSLQRKLQKYPPKT